MYDHCQYNMFCIQMYFFINIICIIDEIINIIIVIIYVIFINIITIKINIIN